MSGDTPERKQPESAKDTTKDSGESGANTTMPPRCDEYGGGGGSFPDTRNRADPNTKDGDCDRIGNAPG